MATLTDVQIKHWVKAGRPVVKADGDGLAFTLSKGGTAAWILRYRFGGHPRELTIGRYPDINLATARELTTAHRARIQQGGDPAREKQQAKHEAATAKSFRQLADDYMEKTFPRLAENTVKQRGYHIRDLILPKLGHLAARDVTTADVVSLVEKIGQRSVNVAELAFTAVSEICKHGVARHVVTTNPCAGISVTAICGQRVPRRSRLKLTEDELRIVLPALSSLETANALAVKILLATCARIGELARAEWGQVDFEKAEWTIPDQNSKTRRGFVVPLPEAVVQWFRELQVFACGSRFVLPARQARRRERLGNVPFEQRSLNGQLHGLCDRLGDQVRRFTPHDLRSTARSHLAALGVNVVVSERCLNHSLGGLLAVYDKHDYLTERRAALALWTSFIRACESGQPWKSDNVVPMRTTTTAA